MHGSGLAHVMFWQKPVQNCEAISFNKQKLKKKEERNTREATAGGDGLLPA